jgi:hypothetical protein
MNDMLFGFVLYLAQKAIRSREVQEMSEPMEKPHVI